MKRLVAQTPEAQNSTQQNDAPERQPVKHLLARWRGEYTPARLFIILVFGRDIQIGTWLFKRHKLILWRVGSIRHNRLRGTCSPFYALSVCLILHHLPILHVLHILPVGG